MMKLYDTFPMRYERPRKDLPEHVASWSSGAREIYRADGSYAGYMVLSKRWDFAVREIRLYEPKELTRVLNTLLLQEKKETVTLNVSPFDYELLNEIYETAEDIRSVQMCRINLLKPERFIAACLNTKQDLGGELPQGSLVIDGVLGRFEIVNDGRFSVSETKKPAQISLPDHLFYPFVFGPVPQSMSQFPELPVKFRSWFPAPFYIPSIDRY